MADAINRNNLQMKVALMDDRDQHARALRQLRSDLAAFAQRLDAFEARRKLTSFAEAIKATTSTVNDV